MTLMVLALEKEAHKKERIVPTQFIHSNKWEELKDKQCALEMFLHRLQAPYSVFTSDMNVNITWRII